MKMSFTVPGVPVPLERPRFSRGRTYLPEKSRNYRQDIQDNALEAIPEGWNPEADYAVTIHAHYRDGSVMRRHDVDNLVKAVLDALNKLVWKDDNQVAFLIVMKDTRLENQLWVEVAYD